MNNTDIITAMEKLDFTLFIKPAMTQEQELWWNYYHNREFTLEKHGPPLPLEEKISLIDPSFNEYTKNIPEAHAKWLKWYKFGNISKSLHEYETEPELNISFNTRREILENDRIRQYEKVIRLLDDKTFIEPYNDEEKKMRIQIKHDFLIASQIKRSVFPNRDRFLFGKYAYSYRIDNNHKELLHPEYVVFKLLFMQYTLKNPSLNENVDEFCYRFHYERACKEFKRDNHELISEFYDEETDCEETEEESECQEIEEDSDY